MKLRSTLVLSALLAGSAFSQDGERPRPPGGPGGPPPDGRNPGEMLKRADADGDGKVSKDEFLKARANEMDEAFGRLDANADGFIDQPEVDQIAERMRAAGRGGPDGMRRPEGEGMRRPEGEGGFRRPPEGPDGRPGGEGMRRPEGEGGFRRPEGGDRPAGGRPEGAAAFMDQAFGRMDQDGNGQLSRDEFNQGMTRMREMMGRGGMARGEGPRGPGPDGRGPGAEGGFRRPPQQDGDGPGKPRPDLESEKPAPAPDKPAPEKKEDA